MKNILFNRTKVTKFLQANYHAFSEHDEFEAALTHWMHSPQQCPPMMPLSVHYDLSEIVVKKNPSIGGKKDKIAEEQVVYQPTFQFIMDSINFPPPRDHTFTFIDLFAGIGGFRIAMQENGGKCLFSSEWDKYAKQTYEANYGEVPYGDIRNISEESIPNHDVLCAGFPCQPFSLAGVSARNSLNSAHGFECTTQGTLFFDIARIVKAKKPKILFLENVKNLIRHNNGETFSIIKRTIKSLGYSFSYELINSSPLVPQKRVRCYMVCIRDDKKEFEFPPINGPALPLKSILENSVNDSFTISSKLWAGHQRRTARNIARGTGFTAFCADIDKPSNTIVARYGKDGKECLIPQAGGNPRMLTPRECARLQGFPENFIIPVAKTTAYRQFGNSVAIPVIRKIVKKIVKLLDKPN